MEAIDPERVKGKDLQIILGISHQTIARLQKAKVLISVGAGKFHLATAVKAYIAYLADDHTVSGAAEQKRLTLGEQYRKLKLANDLRERASIPLAEAERVADEAMVTFRGNLEGMAGRVSSELAAITNPAQIKDILANEHRRVLQACSDRFARLGAAAAADGVGDPAAAGADGRPVGKRGAGAAAGKRRARPVPE